MDWEHERRLVFGISEKWSGWLCQRCCWSRKLPVSPSEREGFSERVSAEFEVHDCETYARENWPENSKSKEPPHTPD